KLGGYNAIVFFPFTLVWKRPWILVGALVVMAVTGCFRKFYHTGTTNTLNAAQIDSLKEADKYFIIHFPKETFNITDLRLNGDSLAGNLRLVAGHHTAALDPAANSTRVMKGKYAQDILQEVHIYSNYNVALNSMSVSIPKNSLYRMDIYKFDKGRTTTSTVASIFGIVVFLALIVLALSAGSTSSAPPPPSSGDCNCPRIHIEKEGRFEYVNGVFSGAVYSNLERSDILALENLQPDSNIRIRITNTPGEKQFMNTVSLVAVKHGPSEKVLADRKGNFLVLDRFETALNATDQKGNEISDRLNNADDISFNFDQDLDQEGSSSAILEFDYPKNARTVSLMVRAKNTNWASSLTQTYVSLFGDKFPEWRKHIEKTEPAIMEQRELEQSLPISVYIQNGDKWEFVDHFPMTGSTAYRELVMSIPILTSNNNGKLRIRLETVFNFWQLDHAVIDPDPGTPAGILTYDIPPSINAKGLKDQLDKHDRNYLVIGDDEPIDLNFNVPRESEKGTTSYFLKASGYYHYEDHYMGAPDMSRLQDFKTPGAFSRFSKQQYREYLYWASLK
ncbi:MAG TPA: hypothetical protein VFX73_06165, partial [Chitinophagaceae bacterium]|nr:hypothetical protein [Chitinophagaceae bacterium]